MKALLGLLIIVSVVQGLGHGEYGPEMENKVSTATAKPSDVASVSKFIRDIQKQLKASLVNVGKSTLSILEDYELGSETLGSSKDGLSTESSKENSTNLVNCQLLDENSARGEIPVVEVVNASRLLVLLTNNPNITSKSQPAPCLVVLFFAPNCPFSSLAAPHYNALARAFPHIKLAAINVHLYQSFNPQFGIAGVPTLMLFYNGRPASKFNLSEYTLEMFSAFISKVTGLKPAEKMWVTSADFGGPVPSVIREERDIWLLVSWAVVLAAIALATSRSPGWRCLVETVQSAWREAQAHHEHQE